MELELGLKATRTREDVSSSVDFRFSKDPFGPLVLTRETDSRFIIIIHIKGFKKEGIEIDINKEGDRITIEGRKPVEEMVMIRWMAWRQEVEFRVFKKVFRIPDTVVLDEIKARFDDDDATLTITMPKRVKGIPGFNIEEEEEERVDKGEVEEQSTVREESDAHSEKFETEIQRDEEFGEKETQVLGEQQNDEEETGDDYLEKSHQFDEQDKILEHIEDEKQLAESNEDSSLRKPLDIEGQGHEQTRHDEQDKKQKRVDKAESKSDDFGSTTFEEIDEQEPDHEQLDRTSKSGAKEKKTTDGDDDGLSKDQGIQEKRERCNDNRKIQDIVQGKGEEDKKKIVKKQKIAKKEINNGDAKEKIDAKMGEVLASNFADTAMKTEDLESDEELDKIEKLVEKKENAKVGAQSEDISLTKPTDFEGRDFHEQTRHEEQENSQHSETEIQREEEFGERESQVLGEEQKDIEETDDDNLDKINQIEEQEEEKIVAESNKENEDSSLRKLPDIQERDSHEQTRHEEQERVVEQQDSQAETNSNNFGCRAFEDQVGEQKPHVTKSREMEKEKIEDDDVGLRKVQEIEEPEIHNEESNKVEGEASGDERNKTAKMDIKNRDAKEKVDGKMGEGFRPNIDRTQLVAENDIGETETKTDEFESDKLKADEVHKIHELVEKKEDEGENANLRGKSKDISLKLQENEEQQSKGQKRQDKQEMIEELVEEKTPKAEPNTGNDIPKPVQAKTSDKEKEETKSVKMEIKTGDAKEEVDAKMGGGFAPNIAETATKFEFESEKLDSDEVDKIQKLVLKTEDEEGNDKVGTQGEDISSRKLQEIKQELNEPARSKKESKTQELVQNKRNDEEIAETETSEQESNRPKIIREQEKIQQQLAEEKNKFSKNGKVKEKEEIAEKKTEFCDDDDGDDISRKFREVEQQDSDAMKGQEEKDMIQESALEEKVSDGGKGIVAVLDTKAENDKSKKVQEIDQQQLHEEDRCGKQFQKLIVGEVSGRGEVDDMKITEEEKGIRDSSRKGQETAKTDSELHNNREVCRSEEKKYYRPEKMEQELVNLNSQLEQDNVEDGEKNQEPVEEEIKDCKEEDGGAESKIKTDDDVVRKVQGIKEHESYRTEREHVSKVQELVEEKIGDHEQEKTISESEVEGECDSLRKVDVSKSQQLHEPKRHRESDKTRITGAEEPSCQEDEKIVEPMTTTEDDNPVDVPEINKEQPDDKLESEEKPYKIQEVVEARLNDHKEEEQEEKATAKAELETERESSKKVEETEQQNYDGPKMQNIAVEQKRTVEMRTKTKDGSLTKVQDDEDQESSKPYKRKIEDKTQELVEMGTSDYREKAKKQDENYDILRSQEDLDEFERHGERSNIPQLVEEENVENIAELGGESYEDWTHEEREKRKYLVKEEAADLKDKHTGGDDHTDDKQEQHQEKIIVKAELKTDEDSSKRVQETEKQDEDELQRSMTQDKMQETEEKDKSRAIEENEIVERREKTINESLRKVQEDEEDPQLGKQKRHGEEDRIHELVVETELNDHRGKVKKKDRDGVLRRSQETVKMDLGERERHCKKINKHISVKDEHTVGGEGEHDEEERYEEVAEAKKKVEQVLYKSEGVLKEEVSDREKEEENLVDDSTTKIQETGKEELHELEMYKKQDMVLDFLEDETGDQKDEKAEEAVVATNANESSRTVQTIEEKSEVDKETNKIPEISDPEVKETKEKVPKARNVRETKELEAHVQEEGKTENCKDDGQGRREENGKQGKIVETMSRERFKSTSDDGIVRKEIQETKVQDSNEKKNQEQKGKIEETERRESSSHEVKLVTEDDSLRKGQEILEKESNVSKRGQVEAKTKINNVKSREEEEEQKKIRKKMEEKSNAPEKEREANEKVAEERMQDKTDNRTKNQEIKGEELYEFLRNVEHDKIPEYHREEGKGMEQSEIEEMKRTTEDCSSRKVQQNKVQESDEVEKHRKLSEIQESSNTQESVGKETQKHSKENKNERGGYNAVLKEKSMASSESQDAEEKRSDQPKRYAEQKERKEELFIREGEQKEKAKKMSQVDSKANDDSSKINHQEVVEIDQRKEELEEENVVGKAQTIDEYESSRKIQEHEKLKSDKLETHGEEEMSKKLAEQGTSDDKEAKEGNRAGEVLEEVDTKIRDDGFGKVRELEEQETDKKQSYVGNDISGKSKKNKNQETKRKDDNRSGNKTQANEKQESHEQKRNEEEVVEKEEIIEEHDSSRKIHEHDRRKSDTMSGNIAEEETSDDEEAKERNRAGAVLGEVLKIREIEKHEQDNKQSFVDTSGKAKENKNQETKRTDDNSSGNKTQKQESHKKKTHDDQDKKNPGLLGKKTNSCRNEDKKNAEAEVSRKLKGVEKRESTKKVETHENRDDIKELVEEKMNNKEGQEKESIITDVLAKAEDDELRKQDKSREQRLRDNLKYEETSKTETKRKDNEQERIKEQGRIKELVEDRTHSCREKENKETEFEDSKKIQERDKEESTEAGRNEKRDKIQEPVDRETSDDDEEELEIEFEEEEENWEAEVIQETDSDHEDNNDIRHIKRIRLGFRLVGGSTLFMSLIVIVISFIRSKRKIRCYKF